MLWRTAIRWCGSRGGESARRPRGVRGGCASEVVRRSVGWWLRAGLPEVARRIGASGWVFRCRRLAGVAEDSRRSVMVVALPIVGWWRRAGVAEVARGFWRGIGGSLVEAARAWRTSRADRWVGRGRRAGVVEAAESSVEAVFPLHSPLPHRRLHATTPVASARLPGLRRLPDLPPPPPPPPPPRPPPASPASAASPTSRRLRRLPGLRPPLRPPGASARLPGLPPPPPRPPAASAASPASPASAHLSPSPPHQPSDWPLQLHDDLLLACRLRRL
ncbi:hypothetical protein GUJ93_ZPchr0009g169 [Zizania palustris]|uniref:Uncharacterized protein n=1 Tax=Zizania palustris TaxID=103762 RepID=A0A8J5R416_ZIZPA|nr:hypothetical protein GUJ93_ZPchr0009g169 [Zizania palustris]